MLTIVNADDFGRSKSRNLAIVDSFENSYITQTTLMMNLDYTKGAVQLAKDNGFIDKVGLHLNLTLGTPLTNKIKKLNLYCNKSEFKIKGYTSYKRLMIPIHIEIIREELEAQIKEFLNKGFTLMHLDSHNWIHLSLPVWIALKPLITKYGFKSVRPIRPGLLHENYKKNLYYRFVKSYMQNSKDIIFVDYSSNIEQFIDNNISTREYDYIELFTHPDYINGILMDNSWSYNGRGMQTMKNNIDKIKKNKFIDYSFLHNKEYI